VPFIGFVEAPQDSPREGDVDPFDGVVEESVFEIDEADGPTRVAATLTHGFETRRRRHGQSLVQSRIDPRGCRLLGGLHRFVEGVAGGKAQGLYLRCVAAKAGKAIVANWCGFAPGHNCTTARQATFGGFSG
jgi:hypothetical protein